MFPREFQNYDNTESGTDRKSVQLGAGKVSCNKAASVVALLLLLLLLYFFHPLAQSRRLSNIVLSKV